MKDHTNQVPEGAQILLEEQSEIYKITGVDESAPLVPSKKRKQNKSESVSQATPLSLNQLAQQEASGQRPKKARINTAVYVTSIPLDADSDEVRDVFSKCGVIAEEIDSGKPRIKMYENEQGHFKGDALVVYFRPESVNLAVQMLDDSHFRLGVEGPGGKMRVQAADFSYKSQQDPPVNSSKKDQKKIIKKTQKLNSKLADWDDDEPSTVPGTSSRWGKVVILKHMFTLQELEEDPATILEIKEDIREECAKLGEVTNVVLFDKEPDGVASIRFADAQAASACVRLMDGRWFNENRLEAYIAGGTEKFKKTDNKKADVEKDEQEDEAEDERLDKFGSWLEAEEEERT